ncbi:S-layer homology domain-containing protein [Bacillus sp. FJAT-29790]|uniref:S-layer homology domain-containing protein n=1 Tax=Bacillus sp. FJAT-29790 TaxID=1895002 RepID=UPI001C24EB78|nr:S-layer homology domain-containing protein [Bacillus sp. FJAT-29790]MBU8881120.1 S-layer homology domain-containing protein [Bacillus sp. FJAT-29790]
MRKVGFLASVFALIFALLIPAVKADAATTFKDVPKDFWAAEEIYRFTDSGIINGYKDGTFRPNQPITRAQAAIILAGGLELDTKDLSSIAFKDIDKGHHAYAEIAAITKAGIMKGSNGEFQPNKPLTRAQMAIIITNAFGFKGNHTSSFKDVPKNFHAYDHIDAIFANHVTTGYEDGTFKPNAPTTRAQFSVFLAKAIDNSQSVADLLKKAYDNELAIETYAYKGSMNLGLTLPKSLQNSPEAGMIASMLKDIQVDISGSYQKDPMLMDATVDLTLSGDIKTTISLPMVITKEKMWMKVPQTPFAPLPEELNGKFIEFDMKELQELQGQPIGALDIDLQTELALAINHLFLDQFADDFYNVVKSDSIKVPSDIHVKHVVKFELTNENLQPFVETLFKGFLPQFFELLQEPKYAKALGMTEESIEMAKEGMAHITSNIDEIVKEINNVLAINKFEEYVVINQDDFIAYNLMDLNLDIKVKEETYGFKLSYDQAKSKINEAVEFQVPIPDEANVISYKELLELEQ